MSHPRAGLAPRPVWLVLFVAWAAAIWWLSSRPDPGASLGVDIEIVDWLAHGIAFAAGGFLAYGFAPGATPFRRGMVALLSCVAWGVIDEVHQSFVPGRHPDAMDVLADFVGAALGTLFHVVLPAPGRTHDSPPGGTAA